MLPLIGAAELWATRINKMGMVGSYLYEYGMMKERSGCKIKHLVIMLGFMVFFSTVLTASNLQDKYKAYNGVIKNLEFSYVIDVKGDSLAITQTNTKEVELLTEHKGFTKDYIFFSGFTSISDKEAYTLVPNSKGFDKLNVEQFQESNSTDGGIFYDDSKILQFTYPSVENGASTYLKYTINYKNPRFLRACYLQSYLPVEKVKVSVKVHRDVELGFKMFNEENADISFKEYKKGKYTYYEWTAAEVMPYQYEVGNYYTASYFTPHISFYLKKSTINDKTVAYFGTPKQLYDYYYDFVDDVNINPSDELKGIVKEITANLSDEEKARAIYYWVHKNIKYVAYEQGYAGFIPTEATEVLSKRFGDCKGMSSLIKTMMDLAGLPTYYTWVGTRHIPYTYGELPLPSVDNHMIASRIVNDSLILLDGTFEYLDYGVYPYHIQGKEVLVGKGREDFQIFKVPISPASYSVVSDSVVVEMKDLKVLGSATVSYHGFNKLELAHRMDGVKQENYHKTFSRIFNKGNNKFRVTSEKVSDLFKYDVPAKVDYEFEISDYYKEIGDELYLNLNLDKSFRTMLVDTTGTISPVQNDFYCTERFVTQFKIPQGYEVTYIPKGGSFRDDKFGYEIKYKKEGDYIVLEKEFVLSFFILLEDKIPTWNKMIKSLNKNYRQTLVLKKIIKASS